MKKLKYILLISLFLVVSTTGLKSYSPMGRNLGFGIMLGEPTGLTAKLWTEKDVALAFSLGNSYMGSLRIGADYLWHFDAFNSPVVNMYAGPGLALGIGASGGWWYHYNDNDRYKKDNDVGLGARGVFGMNIVPRKAPIEIFGELGVMIGILPAAHSNLEGAIGIRFYFK